MKKERGITLIALIITIIILLILAGVTINLTLGENGLFKTAQQAAKNYMEAQDKELGLIDDAVNQVESILANEQFNKTKGVNKPKIDGTGLTPVTINADGSLNIVSQTDDSWYNYIDTSLEGKASKSQWANAKTEDNSLWVWIPRFAYKITYTNASDKSAGGTIDVVFLKGATKQDANGNDVTSASYVDAKGNTGAYIIHPAFRDGSETGLNNGYANGEWDAELTGFWMAKFEAGYAGTAGDASTATDSTVPLSVIYQWNGSISANLTSYYGDRAIGDLIKYPVFQANRPSMNNLGISDAYDLSLKLTVTGNPYGLTSSVDSHLTKNSEWGAVRLSNSQQIWKKWTRSSNK